MTTVTSSRVGRAVLLALSAGTVVYALAVVVFGIVDLVVQLSTGEIRPTMYWSKNVYLFTDDGDGTNGVHISGVGGSVGAIIIGASPTTVAIYVTATVVGLLTQVALGALAIRMVARLRTGRPFDRSASRDVGASSIVVLALGITSQLLDWWARLAVIAQSGGGRFSTEFVWEPLTVTIGLTLAIVAFAFRSGEQLQRETEGLI